MRARTPRVRQHAPLAAAMGVALLASTLVVGGAGAALAPAPNERNVVIESVTMPTLGRGGDAVDVTATLRNPGTATASDLEVSYTLPPSTSVDLDALSAACTPRTAAAAILDCSVASIPGGGTASLTIPLAATDPDTTLGSSTGSFSAVRTAGWDPLAGEVLVRSWDLEAGAQGRSLQECWPIDRPSPNMDIDGAAGTDCDGTVDAAAQPPDASAVHFTAPPAFSERVTRSWEWRATYTPTSSGTHLVCGILFDDGGYVAMAPVGQQLTSGDVVLDIDNYASGEASVQLNAGTTYQVIVRISNRGPAGLNNGGSNPGGWNAVGISAGSDCDASDASALGVDAAGIPTTPSTVNIAGLADVGIVSALTGTVRGTNARISSAIVANAGPDVADPIVSLDAGAGRRVTPTGEGCLISNDGQTAKCALGTLDVDATSRVTHLLPAIASQNWTVGWLGGVDPNPSNDTVLFPGT